MTRRRWIAERWDEATASLSGGQAEHLIRVLRVEEGSLYPALYRMVKKGWIEGEHGLSENNRRAKYYRLTSEGRKQLSEQTKGWERLAQAVSQAVLTKQAPAWAKAGG